MQTGEGSLGKRMHTFLAPAGVGRVCRWTLGAIFLSSGVLKLIDPAAFATVIAGFGLLPDGMVFPAALFLPVLEVGAGVGIFLAIRGSLAVIAGMLVLFMAVLLYGINLGLDIDCGCFGPEDPEQAYKSLRVALARDAVMMAAVFFVYWSRGRTRWRTGRL